MPRPAQDWYRYRMGSWREKQTQIWSGPPRISESNGYAEVARWALDRAASISNPKDADGWRSPSPYHLNRWIYKGSSAGYRKAIGIDPTSWLGYIEFERWGLPSWLITDRMTQFPIHLRNVAEREALLKLKDQKVDFSVMVGEVRSTAKMFAENTTRLAGAVRAVKRGDPADALKHLGVLKGARKVHKRWDKKTVPNRWLEVQYGVLPLVNDVVGSAEELARTALDPLSGLINVRARETSYDRETYTTRGRDGFDLVERSETRHEAYVRLSYLPDPKFSAFLSRWGLSNPAATAYELMPFSLVLDWALPVGQWLSALDADNGYTFKGGSVSYVSLAKNVGFEVPAVHYSPPSRFFTGEQSSMSATVEGFRFNRGTYSSSPFPWYPSWRELTLPSLKQAANGLAMLASAFLSR